MSDTPQEQALREQIAAQHAAEQASRDADLPAELDEVNAAIDAKSEAIHRFLDGFDDADRAEAARGVYIDGDGNVATRFRRLRSL